MFFTLQDLQKIENYLNSKGVRDTELPSASYLNGKELLALVQNNKNVKVSLKDFLSSFRTSNFINVNEIGNKRYYTLEEALDVIQEPGRIPGCIITFLNKEDVWEVYQFLGTSNNDWKVLKNWRNILAITEDVFKGFFTTEELLLETIPEPEIGYYAFVGSNLNEAYIYTCKSRFKWDKTTEKALNYISIIIEGSVTVGENGNWFNDGVDTGIPAKGEKGDKVYLRLNEDTGNIEYSYDNISWEFLISKEDIRGEAATIEIGQVITINPNEPAKVINTGNEFAAILNFKIPKGEQGATGPKGDTGNGLIIKDKVDSVDNLPSSSNEGDAYLVGTEPPYNLYIKGASGWIDNGQITEVRPLYLDSFGDDKTKGMTQYAVTYNVGFNEYPTFDSKKAYIPDFIVSYEGNLYKFISVKSPGDWDPSKVAPTSINSILNNKIKALENTRVVLSETEYDSLLEKDDNVFYYVYEE